MAIYWIKLNLSQINYILPQIKDARRSISTDFPLQTRLSRDITNPRWYYSFKYNEPAIFADGRILEKINILRAPILLDKFEKELIEYKERLEASPEIKNLIVYLDPIRVHEIIFPTSSHGDIQIRRSEREEIKFVFYLLVDRIDFIYQSTIYIDYPLIVDKDKSVVIVNDEFDKLVDFGLNPQIFGNTLLLSNIDEFVYLILEYFFPDLPENLIGKTSPIDYEGFLNKYPELAIKYMELKITDYSTFSEILIRRPEYYPEFYALGEKFINFLNEQDDSLSYYLDIPGNLKLAHYYQAKIILLNPVEDEERRMILEHLLLADDYGDAEQLRSLLAWEWAGYSFGQSPFKINLDADTIFNLIRIIRNLKKDH